MSVFIVESRYAIIFHATWFLQKYETPITTLKDHDGVKISP